MHLSRYHLAVPVPGDEEGVLLFSPLTGVGGASPDVVWGLSVEQRLRQTAHAELTAFVAGHNLFFGSQALT